MSISVPGATGVPWSGFPQTGQRQKQRKTALFLSSGTWTVPAGVAFVYLEMVGGGGGGKGAPYTGSVVSSMGDGGNAGMFLRGVLMVVAGIVYPVTVGAGGTAGDAFSSAATAGGDTVFGTGLFAVTAPGGMPGKNGASSYGAAYAQAVTAYGPGHDLRGLLSNNLVAVPGGRGGANVATGSAYPQPVNGEPCEGTPGGTGMGGGASVLGKGGNQNSVPPTANSGAGGGGGYAADSSVVGVAGANGAAGMVRLIWEE